MVFAKRRHLFWNSFFIYFVCIAVLLAILVGRGVYAHIAAESAVYDASKAVAAEHIVQMTETQFALLEETVNEIYLSNWYKKSVVRSSIYEDEFDIVYRMEIAQDLRTKVMLLSFVDDILILNVENQSVICKYGWFNSVDRYTKYYCDMDLSALSDQIKSADLFEPVQSLDDRYRILSYPDSSISGRARIAALVNVERLEQYLSDLQYDNFLNLQPGWPDAASEGEDSDIRCQLRRPGITLHFEYAPFSEVRREENLQLALSSLFWVLLASGALATLFAWLFAEPLERLVRSLSLPPARHANHHRAYQDISRHIDSIARENENLQQRMDKLVSDVRAEILLHLMGSDASQINPDDIGQFFPWLVAGKPYFFLLIRRPDPRVDEIAHDHVICLRPPFSDYCGYLIWTEDPAGCTELLNELNAAFSVLETFSCSAIRSGPESLSICCQEALAQIDVQRHAIPLTDVLALFDRLQNGDREGCAEVLRPYSGAEGTNCSHYVVQLLKRWVQEKRFGIDGDLHWSQDESWEEIFRLIDSLCDADSTARGRSGSAIIDAVNRVMNQYYGMPELSLKYFAGQFDISVSKLSRLYQQKMNVNFSDALLEIRIRKAKELLDETDQSIAAIAAACGYENYPSFKRAFARREGVSPREYRNRPRPDAQA